MNVARDMDKNMESLKDHGGGQGVRECSNTLHLTQSPKFLAPTFCHIELLDSPKGMQ